MSDFDIVTLSRAFFGTSLAFHIIFASLAIGVSLMIWLSEMIYLFTKDKDYQLMAKRWTRSLAIVLGVAIPSGTIVGVQIILLWPGFMKIVGHVIAVPFQIELFAFFLEALAISLYVYAADRMSPILRLINSFLVAFGASASGVLITSVNAWMNTPAGFQMQGDGRITDIDPWKAFFNPSFFNDAAHVVVSAWMAGAFAIVSVAAFRLLRKQIDNRERQYHQKNLYFSLTIAFITSLLTVFTGHSAAVGLHQYSPEKLAAAEALYETKANAPLLIGGLPNHKTESVQNGFELPGVLSWLAGGSPVTVVKGLREFPKETWPPEYVHTLFNLMVGIGFLLLIVSGLLLLYGWIKRLSWRFWHLRCLVAAGPIAMIGIELGWIFTCSGRQPWTIYGIQTVAEAATRSTNVGWLYGLFVVVYLLLSLILIMVLRSYFRRNPLQNEWRKDDRFA